MPKCTNRSACSYVLQLLGNADKRFDHMCVELRPAAPAQLLARFGGRKRRAICALIFGAWPAYLGVVRVYHRNDSAFQRDRIADEFIGIPFSVNPLVVMPHPASDRLICRHR